MSDVRPGYKRTEVGVIPKEWEALSLGSLFSIKAAGDLDKAAFGAEQTDVHPSPIFANALTNAGLYGFSKSANYAAPALTITARGDVGKAFFRNEPFSAIGRLLVLQPLDRSGGPDP
jgi:type I restriction enzyme, S subunit